MLWQGRRYFPQKLRRGLNPARRSLSMSLPSREAGAAVNPVVNAEPSRNAGTRLQGRRRVLICAGVGTMAIFSLGTYATIQGHQFPAPLVNLLIRFGFFLVFSLFPNGRFVPRWTPVLVGVFLAEEVSYNFLNFWPLGETGWPSRFAELLWLA